MKIAIVDRKKSPPTPSLNKEGKKKIAIVGAGLTGLVAGYAELLDLTEM